MAQNTMGERISSLLEKRGMTQRELADRAGVTEVSMSRYISGNREPKAIYLSNIARVLGTTVEYLINGSGNNADAEDDFFLAHKAIARSANKWTPQQKNELAKTLFDSN